MLESGIAHRRAGFAGYAISSEDARSAVRIPEPMTAEAPKAPHPLPAMTTYELKDYRKLLDRALDDKQVGQAPVAADLRARLEQVTAEEEQRLRIRRGERKGTHSM